MNEKELIEKVLEQVKNIEGENVTFEDAKAALDFIKDQTDFDLCKVIAEAIAGNPESMKKLQSNMEKIGKISLYVAGGALMAAAAVLAAPAVMAAIPVLGGAGAATAGGTALAVEVVGTTAVPAVVATTELAVVSGGVTAGTTAAIGAAGAVTGAGLVGAGEVAVASGAAKGAAVGSAAVLATKGVSKILSKKNIVAALSSTLLIADICEAVKEVAPYDVALNQGNTKLLESNHKINPIYEEALWKIEDYDTQMFFVGTEVPKYKSNMSDIEKQVEKCTPGGICVKPFSEATVVYCNIVTKDNNMYMYTVMLNHEWFHPASVAESNKQFLTNHAIELLGKYGITRDNVAYVSLTSGTTKIVSEEFLRGKDTREPLNVFYDGSRLRIPQSNNTSSLEKVGEDNADVQNSIVSNVVSNLKCEYVMNNLDKQATVYKFVGDIKTVKDCILKTAGVLELNTMLCSDKKIRVTISKLSDKLGNLNSIGLAIIPDVGMATVNVLAGDDIKERIIADQVDKGLILSFTSAAGVSMESGLMLVNKIYLFWTELGGKEVELNQTNLSDSQIAIGDRNTSERSKKWNIPEHKDKDGRVFRLGSEKFYLRPNYCKLVASYLSENEDLRLTYRTVTDAMLVQNKGVIPAFNKWTKLLGQGTFLNPKTTLSTLKDAKSIVTPEVIFHKIEYLCRAKKAIVTVVFIHDKHNKRCHVFDYYVGGEKVDIGDEEIHEFAEFPFTIDGESIIAQPDRFDIFCI